MKRYIRAESSEIPTKGTTFYSLTMDQILDFFEDKKQNAWIYMSFKESGWKAIDFEHNLFGSKVVDDILYLCVTDSADIEVNGKSVDPEDALEDYAPEDLAEFIKEGTDAVIKRYITEYEVFTPKYNEWASDLLKEYDFTKLVDDYQEFQEI